MFFKYFTLGREWRDYGMASKYDGLARIIIQNVGGKGNITGLKHCVTRLRFNLKDESLANTDVLKDTDGVVTVIQAGGQYQVVIGNHVDYVYDAVIDVGHLQGVAAGSVDEDGNPTEDGGGGEGGKTNALNVLIDVVSGVLQPTLGVLGASGIVKGILACLTYFHLLSSDSGTYQILYAFADGFMYFLPIFLGYTAAKKFKMNEFIGMALGAGLVYPNMVALKSAEALGTVFTGTAFEMSYTTKFLGIPVFFPASGYTSSVVPIIIACLVASKLYQWSRKVIPEMIQLFMVPLLVVGVTLPLTYLVIGPVAGLFCGVLQAVFNVIYNLPAVGGALAGAFVGAIWQICVIFGLHWGLVPLMYINFATLGYDYVLAPNITASWTQFAALAAVLVKSKDNKMKKVALPAFISAFFGVTEPAIYGVTLPKKTPFVISCVASAIGGGIVGMFGAVKYMSGGMGLFALPCFIDPREGGDGMRSLIIVCIAILVAMVISFVGTAMTWKDAAPKKKKQEEEVFADEDAAPAGPTVIYAPVAGSAKPLTECSDEVFASEALGKGIVIDPSEGKLYAPCNGTVTNLAETLHAVGLQSEDGAEILIHVGMDTVGLNGKGFHAHCKTGDKVKAGQLLLEFDMDFIKSKGLSTATPVVITNSDDYPSIQPQLGMVQPGDKLLTLSDEKASETWLGAESISAPISGEVRALSECPDELFASGKMGQGFVLEPSEGKVFAPCDGTVKDLFQTLHALGITSNHGAELLLHIGMDTVDLNAMGFTAHCKSGDKVKKGDLLVEFDIPFIKSKNLPVTTPVIVTNGNQYSLMMLKKMGKVQHGEEVLDLKVE